jgi:hypothetical protein
MQNQSQIVSFQNGTGHRCARESVYHDGPSYVVDWQVPIEPRIPLMYTATLVAIDLNVLANRPRAGGVSPIFLFLEGSIRWVLL